MIDENGDFSWSIETYVKTNGGMVQVRGDQASISELLLTYRAGLETLDNLDQKLAWSMGHE